MRLVNFLFTLVSVAVAGSARTQTAPDSAADLSTRKFRIVVIGSSTAAGHGANPADSAWVNRYRVWLQQINPENEVLNLALGGFSTYQLLPSTLFPTQYRPAPDTARNITRALALRPDAILINLPSNDAASGYRLEEQLENFNKIIKKARSAAVPVWVFTTQPRNFSADKVLIQLLAQRAILAMFGEQAIDVWTGLAEPNGLLEATYNSGDGTHLNNAGHRFIFEQVKAAGIPEFLARVPERSWWARLWQGVRVF